MNPSRRVVVRVSVAPAITGRSVSPRLNRGVGRLKADGMVNRPKSLDVLAWLFLRCSMASFAALPLKHRAADDRSTAGAEEGEFGGELDSAAGGRQTSVGVSLCRHRIISTELSKKRAVARLVSISSRLSGPFAFQG